MLRAHVLMDALSTIRFTSAALVLLWPAAAFAQEPPAKTVQDNSFLMEEAYNQEPGVVQHIFNAVHTRGDGERAWDLRFIQEWPIFSQRHQFSYAVPYSFINSDGGSANGFGDALLNYRFQWLSETARQPAVAPRFSLILPTGDADAGLGNDAAGMQMNTAISKVLSDRWTVHGNVGATVLPDVRGKSLVSYNLGASAVYAVNHHLNLMLECVGDWEEEVNDSGGTTRRSSIVMSPGVRYGIGDASRAQTVIGIAAPLGLTPDAPDFGVFLYFSLEHAFVRPPAESSSGK